MQVNHRIAWLVVSFDGHPIQGEITFTVTTPPPSAAPALTSSPSEAHRPPRQRRNLRPSNRLRRRRP
ncbi:copper resistance protein CopC [Nonomuraea diastatica]|uniref:CopC domain-containing protein n=1 Tax=Nonomuraea diastatica TaxID=1848329 RepID=A0A4V2YFW8_9ACTN|nr:hypothetical protein E1294_04995 [Nonomuraea diastatica]